MEFGETEKNKVQLQVPWIPITPSKPIVQRPVPILPRPVPIYPSEERRHLGSHFTCFESSAGDAEINTNLHRLSDPAAATRVHISFDNISSSSSSFSQLLAQADAPTAYSYPTHGFLSNQFVPALNSQTQFNQTYAFLGHPHHLSREQQQPFFNVIHDNCQDPQGAGTSYIACYGRAPSQVGLPPESVITAKDKQVVVTQVNIEEMEQGREEENVSSTMCNYPQNKVHDSVIEFASVSTPCKESYNHNKEICHDIDLNKMPQSRPKRRKHRPKVIKEGKPKKTRKPATPKPVPSQENLTGKRKQVRRKGSNSTPQTELTGEWTKELMPESAKKTCRRSLNFDLGEQPTDGHSACRENETTHFDGEIGIKVRETRVINNHMSLQGDAQASAVVPSKSDSPRAGPNAKYAEKGGKMWGSVNNRGGNEDGAKVLSKSVVGSKRTQFGTIQHASNRSINLIGAQYNLLQAYSSKYCVQFPNIQKKRSEKRKFSNTSNTSSMTAIKDVQLATFPQEGARSHSYSSTSEGWISRSAYERAIHDKFQSLEYHLSSGQRMPTKRRSRVTRIHDYASLTSNTANLGNSDRPAFGDAIRPHTCIDALVEEMRGSLTKKKRSKKRSTPTNSVSSSNVMQQHHKFVLENHNLPFHNSLDVASGEIRKNIHTVDALTEQLRHLNIYREARELVLHGQNALVPYNQQNKKYKSLVHEYGTIIPFEGPFDPIKKQRPRPKVDLDEETSRVWKLLMLDINSHGVDGTDEDKAKWWEEERNVFRGRADSFIARMHLVQGDRRFSRWKGSVVDSVVGVFLTQNVSDNLSSSAFMSLAARFPLKSSNKYETYHEESTSLIVDEPQVQILEPEENAKLDEKILNQPAHELSSVTRDIIDLSDEREAVDSNSIDSCRTTGSLTDESNCKLLESAQRHLGEQSTMECASLMTGEGQKNSSHGGVRKELNTLFSSQCSIITSQMFGDFPIDQNPEEIGSFSDNYSGVEDLTTAAKYKKNCNRTSFGELLGMVSSAMLHEANNQRSNPTENLKDSYGQSVVLKHDNQGENLEKSNVTRGSLEATVLHCNEHTLNMTPDSEILEVNCCSPLKVEVSSSVSSKNKNKNDKRSSSPTESESQSATAQPHSMPSQLHPQQQSDHKQHNVFHISGQSQDLMQKSRESTFVDHNYVVKNENSKKRGKEKKDNFDWDSLRIQAQAKVGKREKTESTMDSLDWDAVRRADVSEIADAIRERGMNNMLAERIKSFLNLLVDKHGGIDLEWLRDVPPDQAKEYLLSIRGLGLKSVECVRLLTLHHLAFPVDTNVGRIAVRLGWVPLQPLPESLQLHLLELYPVLESIQKYLWPRLCKLDQKTLYELHYQLITFGKVFCTKSKPNCNACPMRGECRHFASAFASARLALPGPEQKSIVTTTGNNATNQNPSAIINQLLLPLPENTNQANELQQTEVWQLQTSEINICQPIIEEPASPEPVSSQVSENDIEDAFNEESSEIPTIILDMEEFTMNLQNYMQENMELQEGEMSKALVALHPEAACIPTPKLKNVSRLRTEHSVYELPDSHCLLKGWDVREPDDPGRYLLAIWTPGETANSINPPESKCISQDCGQLCNEKECFSCNSFREADSQIVRGTLLIPCRTATRGSFPLNGTYFQVNEVFADHDSSLNPISVPRSWIWNLNRRTVYFGTSVPSIFKGLNTQEIQQCFWRGFVCVRGFDRKTRAPRPLMARLHFPVSKLPKNKEKTKKDSTSANSQQGLNSKPNTEQPELLSNIQNFRQNNRS